MKASEINIRGMKSASQCYKMVEMIHQDSRNVVGGAVAFMSGKTTYLTKTAQNKVYALERRAQMLDTTPDEA